MTDPTSHTAPQYAAQPPEKPVWTLEGEPNVPCLTLRGTWTVQSGGMAPFPPDGLGQTQGTLTFETQGITGWDSAFVSFLWDVKQAASHAGVQFDPQGLPPTAQRLLALLPDAPAPSKAANHKKPPLLERVGGNTLAILNETGTVSELALETAKGACKALTGKSGMRLKDLASDIWNAGPSALLIVGIVNFLVGAILAFVGLVELRRFAAEIYVANLVGIACAREISAIMTAIVMAGRTGGAYAARISTMLGNEEIDALQVFGIPVSSYILLPSILSLGLMMPLLYIYGTLIAIFGGFVVSVSMMDISPMGYLNTTFDGIALREFVFGFVKSFFFASFIALAACRVGLQAGRSAADVGIAATRAVVIGIVGIIAMDAIFAVMATALGI
ncbi:MlaE family ABC transporter permease [Acetobacter orleanensis]|nr:ABC transporter permease [Acetobacter orleanensis]KXV62792.1 ABC transporter permease [Acetobacter orleanensis]PCD79292.1 ABC transporter permease [Acetobacter orleanensis]